MNNVSILYRFRVLSGVIPEAAAVVACLPPLPALVASSWFASFRHGNSNAVPSFHLSLSSMKALSCCFLKYCCAYKKGFLVSFFLVSTFISYPRISRFTSCTLGSARNLVLTIVNIIQMTVVVVFIINDQRPTHAITILSLIMTVIPECTLKKQISCQGRE